MGSWVTAAFRSSRENEAYIFMERECVLDNYAPGETNDKILHGPAPIGEVLPCLKNTTFDMNGVDCAFGSQNEGEAFLFSSSTCAKIYYAPFSGTEQIIDGPKPITQMFPFFKETVFESGVDAAFESTLDYEAYLFKGGNYARINYGPNAQLITLAPIASGWPCFQGSIFESGVEASFASHLPNEAYLFKGDSYARLQYTPGTSNASFVSGVKKIKGNWAALGSILPVPN